jgi:hypothetical protein
LYLSEFGAGNCDAGVVEAMNIMAIILQLASGWYGKLILEHVINDDRRLKPF